MDFDKLWFKFTGYFVMLFLLGGCMAVSERNAAHGVSSPVSAVERPSAQPAKKDYSCLEEPGTIKGVLLENGKPVQGARLYLGSVIKQDQSRAVVFDRVRSITTTTNEWGEFEFRNVPSGEYGVVLDTIMRSYLLLWPDKREPILIVVTGGEGICLGKLDFPELPLPK